MSTVLLLFIVQLSSVVWYALCDRTSSILYSKFHSTFYLWPMGDHGLRSWSSQRQQTQEHGI